MRASRAAEVWHSSLLTAARSESHDGGAPTGKGMLMNSCRSACGVVLLTLACLASGTQAGAGEILGRGVWTDGNGHEYVIVGLRSVTWDVANEDMLGLLPGFHLATITSQAEQDFILNLRIAVNATGQQWIGGFQDPITEPDPSAGWTWVTGEVWSYTNWAFGEPNDGGRLAGEQHLAQLSTGWNDEGSAIVGISGYIAEVPEPSTAVLCALGLIGLAAQRRPR
jgi:hypothetical protein